jgi:hypothetical protein
MFAADVQSTFLIPSAAPGALVLPIRRSVATACPPMPLSPKGNIPIILSFFL